MIYPVAILFGVIHLSLSAMVLPRPPSSQNHIRQDQEILDRKFFEGKSLQNLFQSASVERPDTDDYRFLEIELQRPEEVEASNLQTLVHAFLKQPENESYPNPEVVPNSVLGVRNVGLSPSLRTNFYSEDKHILLHPSKLHSLDEKLYYLKNGRPKVYVNVRGNSGSFLKNSNTKTTSGESLGFLRVTQPFQRQTDWKTQQRHKKIKIPKKYNRLAETIEADREKELLLKSELNKADNQQASVFSIMEEYATTESSMVTSSELPKQIPAPPSKLPARALLTQTTPIQRYPLRRTDVLPSYGFFED